MVGHEFLYIRHLAHRVAQALALHRPFEAVPFRHRPQSRNRLLDLAEDQQMHVDDPPVVWGFVRRFGPADRRPDAATDQALAQAIMLGLDADGVQQAAPNGDEQDGDDMSLNRLDGELKALAVEPEPVAARASRTQKLLARRAVVAPEDSSLESRKVAR